MSSYFVGRLSAHLLEYNLEISSAIPPNLLEIAPDFLDAPLSDYPDGPTELLQFLEKIFSADVTARVERNINDFCQFFEDCSGDLVRGLLGSEPYKFWLHLILIEVQAVLSPRARPHNMPSGLRGGAMENTGG